MTLWFLNCFNGVQFVPENGLPKMVSLINFEEPEKNSFKVVNQLVVEYTNNGKNEKRRPDVVLYINGMPLCVIELKNPVDANMPENLRQRWES